MEAETVKPIWEGLLALGVVLVIGRALDLMTDCRNDLRDINDLLQKRFRERDPDGDD
jgi:hypothetical protein